jgi:hypothetical protein
MPNWSASAALFRGSKRSSPNAQLTQHTPSQGPMIRTQEPDLASRPSRPRWVYGIGLVIVLILVGASLFAVVYRSEVNVPPEAGEPPLITVPSAPKDGEGM